MVIRTHTRGYFISPPKKAQYCKIWYSLYNNINKSTTIKEFIGHINSSEFENRRQQQWHGKAAAEWKYKVQTSKENKSVPVERELEKCTKETFFFTSIEKRLCWALLLKCRWDGDSAAGVVASGLTGLVSWDGGPSLSGVRPENAEKTKQF